MPYVNNGGVRIHYRVESPTAAGELGNEANPPLLLLHGFMQSMADWAGAGYVKALGRDYSLILLDARGHGASDKPHSVAEYGMELLVADLVAVLDALAMPRVHCLGYSFGGWVGFGAARYAPQRLCSLAIGGMHPYQRDPGPLNRRIERFARTRDALAAGDRRGELIPPHVKAQFAGSDIEALITLTTAIRDAAGFEDALDSLTVPGLIYAGEDDPAHPLARQCVAGHSNLQFRSLPGLGHLEAWQRSDLALPHLRSFLAGIRDCPAQG